MRKENINSPAESRVEWEHLEEWVRRQVQGLIQELLEEEITEFLGRVRSARRSSLDGVPGYRNGHSKPRRLTLSSGTIRVKRPRVRNTEERFESRVLPLFARKMQGSGRSNPRAIPPWFGRRGLRLGPAGTVGRGGACISEHRSASEGEVACRVGRVAPAAVG